MVKILDASFHVESKVQSVLTQDSNSAIENVNYFFPRLHILHNKVRINDSVKRIVNFSVVSLLVYGRAVVFTRYYEKCL